ncbi:hypothetical protein GJT83_02245 [Enterobacteriaceae endosymbiont of Plateumaris pusilla]|uniref:TerC family protein n=1 Tax=Enterobacteriaceae endosymbiont of Plateumaris pusilla TaxID=2675795 RepID=UPI0014498735|nr:hypothetical protein [Enterobacteriaceae endosymbiont of Plateumaris pusilla]QJC29704.1 hypothetical protein GJT83_02245 [Enterobacteriaceae endosymbiont of Plateumaris pusilla]
MEDYIFNFFSCKIQPVNLFILLFLIILEIILNIDNIIIYSLAISQLSYFKKTFKIKYLLFLIILLIRIYLIKFILSLSYINNIDIFYIYSYHYTIKNFMFTIGGIILLKKYFTEKSLNKITNIKNFKIQNNNNFLLIKNYLQIIFIDVISSLDSLIILTSITKKFFLIFIAVIISYIIIIFITNFIIKIINKYEIIRLLILKILFFLGITFLIKGIIHLF